MLLYHGTAVSDFKPHFGGGRNYHDYGELGFQVCIKSELAYRKLGKCIDIIKIDGSDYTKYHNLYLSKDTVARKLASNYSEQPQTGKLLSDILKEG